jgi:tetratricopeptide (TPR) repeat protein
MDTAFQIRRNAEEQREVFKDLMEWETEVVKKPIKRIPLQPPRVQQPRIKSNDYRKWDKFDVDKALEDIDYEPFKEEELPMESGEPKDPEESLVVKEKGNLYFKKGKFLKAVNCYTKSIELDRTTPIPLVNRALCYIKLNKFDLAIKDCTKALEIDPKNVKASWRRGIALRAIGQSGDAKRGCFV